MSLLWRQALRLGLILLVCAGITVVTSTFLQTPMGTAALSTLVRRGGPPDRFQGTPNPGAGSQRVRGPAPQGAEGGLQNAGPRDENGGRLAPNIRAGLPDLLRSGATMGLFALVVAVVLRRRKPRRQPSIPARIRPARRPDAPRAA